MPRPVRARLAAIAATASLVAAPLVGAIAAPAVAAAPTSSAAASTAAATTPSSIRWNRCGFGMGIQCAQLEVPLDYADPSKGTTTIDLARRPADSPSRRQGVIMVNPGGPGGSAVFSLGQFGQILGRDIRTRFDLVAVEPRGMGGQDLALCEGKPGQEPPYVATIFPWKPEHVSQHLAVDEFVRDMCRNSDPRILPHMTTADVARDMDTVRAALGQARINYYGVSYGSYLGATYANMFPDRVRTMVVDGVLDPVSWATGRPGETHLPVTTRLGSDIGAQDGIEAAIAECEKVGESQCREHATIRDDWNTLTSDLREATVNLTPGEEGMTFSYDLLILLSLGSLYDHEAIPDLLTLVHEFRVAAETPEAQQQAAPRAALRRAYDRVVQRDARNRKERIGYNPPEDITEEQWPPSAFVGFEGVLCSETDNPSNTDAWVAAGALADRRAPGFGPLWTRNSSICSGWEWKGSGAYQGPFDKKPGNGMMIMTTNYDPATPIHGAKALRSMSPGSRMVTVQGWGHGALDQSACATRARTSYLLSGTLPRRDLSCKPDHALFTSLD
ncbi:MAG: alpha/beta hydrolase [Mobilicoccus sp.]|nr:alpha/beta hydrolase [Mobilicoccus sp.]